MQILYNPKDKIAWIQEKMVDNKPKPIYAISFYLKGHLINAYAYKKDKTWHIVGGWYQDLIISLTSIYHKRLIPNMRAINNTLHISGTKQYPDNNEITPPNFNQ